MRNEIIGRKEQCERLKACLEQNSAQLILVYGRRRVGKTYLINEYFEDRFAFKMTGAYDQPKKVQLANFTAELNRKSGKKWNAPGNWFQAFELLRQYLEQLPQDQKQVVFMDEMPWLDTHKSSLLPAFEFFWNDWGSTRHNLVFIVCGSAASWMDEKFSRNRGGLYNRHTCRIYLEPFNLGQMEEFLKSRKIYWTRYEVVECYMVMGGIPYYLNLLNSQYSFNQNIDRIFFSKRGELWDEFDMLYRTLFTNSDHYIQIVEALAKKRGGLTREELARETGISLNGSFSKMLSNLIASGFVCEASQYLQKKKNMRYQLSDPYTAFYLRFSKGQNGKDEHFWSHSTDLPSRRTWEGLAFEQLYKAHILLIKQKLGIDEVLSTVSVWSNKGDAELGIPGAQIDMVIDRRDRTINLCEIKFSEDEYVIGKEDEASLRNKKTAFRTLTRCRKTIQMTMITTYGVKQNMYSGMIQNQVTMDDLFHEK